MAQIYLQSVTLKLYVNKGIVHGEHTILMEQVFCSPSLHLSLPVLFPSAIHLFLHLHSTHTPSHTNIPFCVCEAQSLPTGLTSLWDGGLVYWTEPLYESLFIPADGYHGNVLGTGCRVERAERGREVGSKSPLEAAILPPILL